MKNRDLRLLPNSAKPYRRIELSSEYFDSIFETQNFCETNFTPELPPPECKCRFGHDRQVGIGNFAVFALFGAPIHHQWRRLTI